MDRHWAKLGKSARRAARRGRNGADIFVAVRARHLRLPAFGTPPRWGRGPVRGCALPRPPLHPPGAPPKKANNFHKLARARDSSCGSFLPSLCSLRRSPSAPRKCQIPLSRWSESASAKHQQQIKSLRIVHCPILLTHPQKMLGWHS